MTIEVRHDCRFCSHSNDSHDPLLGCLYPNCLCANKSPANYPGKPQYRAPWKAVPPPTGVRPGRVYSGHRKGRQRRFWRGTWAVLRWFLGTTAAVVLAALILVGVFVVALLLLLIKGS